MNSLRPFQIVLLAAFGLLAVVALVFLSLYQVSQQEETQIYGDRVLIWGTLSQSAFKAVFQDITAENKPFNVVQYEEISKTSFDEELVNAIAEGRSPDLIVLGADALVLHRAKILPIPYDSFPEREFRDTFVDAAEIFAQAQGIYGVPFAIDPLVMYWNRDLFASNGLAQPPTTWEAVVGDVVPRLTVRNTNRDVLQSGLSFGEYRNVESAKKILMMLALQTGSKMVETEGARYKVVLNESVGNTTSSPFEAVVQFYTDFSNVNSPLYSWNRAMVSAKGSFLGGTLGLYFGLGSEYVDIAAKNPNLNFDVAQVPQGASATILRTYGDVYALAIPKASPNPQGAFAVARLITSAQYAQPLSVGLTMAPARRDLLGLGETNVFRKVALQSALIARSWLDPNPKKSDGVLMQMVEDVVSNRERVSIAVKDAIERLVLTY